MRLNRRSLLALPFVVLAILAAVTAFGGDITIKWNPVPNATEYRVYANATAITDTTPGTVVPGGSTATQWTVPNLTDCTAVSVAVKACNASGGCSAFSNTLRGWPQARITDAVVGSGGITGVTGTNFRVDGNPTVTVDGAARAVTAKTCTSLAFAGGPGSVVKVRMQQHDGTFTTAQFVYVVAAPGVPVIIRVDAE